MLSNATWHDGLTRCHARAPTFDMLFSRLLLPLSLSLSLSPPTGRHRRCRCSIVCTSSRRMACQSRAHHLRLTPPGRATIAVSSPQCDASPWSSHHTQSRRYSRLTAPSRATNYRLISSSRSPLLLSWHQKRAVSLRHIPRIASSLSSRRTKPRHNCHPISSSRVTTFFFSRCTKTATSFASRLPDHNVTFPLTGQIALSLSSPPTKPRDKLVAHLLKSSPLFPSRRTEPRPSFASHSAKIASHSNMRNVDSVARSETQRRR
jgi:hypothetical protein